MTTLAVVGSTGEFGGAEATDIHYVAELVERGIDVRWAVPADGPLRPRLEAVGVSCEVVASPSELNVLSRRYVSRAGASLPRLLIGASLYEARLGRWLRSLRPAGVLATGFRAQLATTPVAAALRLPLAWIASDFVPVEPLACRVWSQMARRPRVIVTYSRAAAEQPALSRSARTLAVPSGVDLDEFPMGPLEREPLLVLVGHLTALKNHLGFLEVLEMVRADHPQVHGMVAGADIYRTAGHDDYVRRVRAAVAATAHASLDAPPPEAVPALLRRAALLLHLTTVPETFGRVCAEAMASGAVVLGFRQGATPEVLGDSGCMVQPGDLRAVATACSALIGDDAQRRLLAERARKRVEANFTVDRARRAGADGLCRALGLT